MNTFNITFKYSENTYCSNIVIADNEEIAKKHYTDKGYEVVGLSVASEYEIEDAKRRGKPIVTVETTMKDYKEIAAEVQKLLKEKEAAHDEIDQLCCGVRGIEDLKKRVDARHSITDRINELATIENDCALKIKILNESFRASFAVYAWNVIKPVLEKYAGKQYGPKTKAKIYEETRAAGVGFYFDSYGGSSRINAFPFNGQCHYSGSEDVTLWAVDENGHTTSFIDKNNRIVAVLPNVNSHYTYVANLDEHIAKIHAAFREYENAAKVLNEKADLLADLLPSRDGFVHYNPGKLY